MPKASTRRTSKPIQPVLRLVSRPPAPHPQCQAVADGFTELKNQALHGQHVGALVMVVHPDGSSTWESFGTLGNGDNDTATAASNLCHAVFRDCWKGA